MIKGRKLFIAPHPDDESFGCGGTILKHKDNGDDIFWLIVTSGSSKDGFSQSVIKNMNVQVQNINSYYKFSEHKRLTFPSTRIDEISLGQVVKKINSFINKIKPDTIYINFRNDVHSDHKAVFDATWSCCKSFRNPFIKSVYAYETLSETDFSHNLSSSFNPNTYNDITKYLNGKIEAIKIYKSELKEAPYPRSVENVKYLAKLRGSNINTGAAEAFICLKNIL